MTKTLNNFKLTVQSGSIIDIPIISGISYVTIGSDNTNMLISIVMGGVDGVLLLVLILGVIYFIKKKK
jgi:hypothetical protein